MNKKIYKNKNGNMDIEQFVKMIHNNKIRHYAGKFNALKNPCPPYDLIHANTQCFFCADCFRYCIGRVKEYKKHYRVLGKKYYKENL